MQKPNPGDEILQSETLKPVWLRAAAIQAGRMRDGHTKVPEMTRTAAFLVLTIVPEIKSLCKKAWRN